MSNIHSNVDRRWGRGEVGGGRREAVVGWWRDSGVGGAIGLGCLLGWNG